MLTFDEIVIGSGLVALAAVLGLPDDRRILVIGGPVDGRFIHYDGPLTPACALLGHGGLGSYWHGVISTHGNLGCPDASDLHFQQLIRHFYPHTDVSERLGRPWLFVPWRPIRPRTEWRRIQAKRADRLVVRHEIVSRFVRGANDVLVQTPEETYRGKRVWVCAGALHTPGLLDRSLDTTVSRPFVADHVFSYLGQIDREHTTMAPLSVERRRDGVWFEVHYNKQNSAMFTTRPARFDFRQVDKGIVRRSSIGVSTGHAVTKVLRGASLGLFAEALYNRSGLFPNARRQSVYAHVRVPDAYALDSGNARLSTRKDVILASVDVVRSTLPWTGIKMSARPDLVMSSRHLHQSVDPAALARAGGNTPTSRVQVVDPSVLGDIGPDHHSFKLMVAVFQRAQALPPLD